MTTIAAKLLALALVGLLASLAAGRPQLFGGGGGLSLGSSSSGYQQSSGFQQGSGFGAYGSLGGLGGGFGRPGLGSLYGGGYGGGYGGAYPVGPLAGYPAYGLGYGRR